MFVCVCLCVAKLVPLAYGIKKLQIACVVEDDKVPLSLCLYDTLSMLCLMYLCCVSFIYALTVCVDIYAGRHLFS